MYTNRRIGDRMYGDRTKRQKNKKNASAINWCDRSFIIFFLSVSVGQCVFEFEWSDSSSSTQCVQQWRIHWIQCTIRNYRLTQNQHKHTFLAFRSLVYASILCEYFFFALVFLLSSLVVASTDISIVVWRLFPFEFYYARSYLSASRSHIVLRFYLVYLFSDSTVRYTHVNAPALICVRFVVIYVLIWMSTIYKL